MKPLSPQSFTMSPTINLKVFKFSPQGCMSLWLPISISSLTDWLPQNCCHKFWCHKVQYFTAPDTPAQPYQSSPTILYSSSSIILI